MRILVTIVKIMIQRPIFMTPKDEVTLKIISMIQPMKLTIRLKIGLIRGIPPCALVKRINSKSFSSC
jgi:hypothetical protein